MNQPAFSHCDGDPVQMRDSSDRGASIGEFVTASVIHDSGQLDLVQHGSVLRHLPRLLQPVAQ